MSTPDYNAGDIVTYVAFGGTTRRVLVIERDTDIKNGQPGFDALLIDEAEPLTDNHVWGYDAQIIRVEHQP